MKITKLGIGKVRNLTNNMIFSRNGKHGKIRVEVATMEMEFESKFD